MTPREKFIGLIQNEILRMDLAELDFGIYRILNHRRRAVEQYLEKTLPDRIAASIAKLEGVQANEEERIYAQLHTFFTLSRTSLCAAADESTRQGRQGSAVV